MFPKHELLACADTRDMLRQRNIRHAPRMAIVWSLTKYSVLSRPLQLPRSRSSSSSTKCGLSAQFSWLINGLLNLLPWPRSNVDTKNRPQNQLTTIYSVL